MTPNHEDAHLYQEDLAYIHHHGFSDLARAAGPWLLRTLHKTGIRNGTIDDWACLVDVQPHPTSPHLRRAITTFRRVGETYRRGYEEHWVYLFSRPELLRQLQEAGFTVRTSRGYGRLAPGRRLFHCSRTRA